MPDKIQICILASAAVIIMILGVIVLFRVLKEDFSGPDKTNTVKLR